MNGWMDKRMERDYICEVMRIHRYTEYRYQLHLFFFFFLAVCTQKTEQVKVILTFDIYRVLLNINIRII